MNQQQLNNIMVLYIYEDKNKLSIIDIANKFVDSEHILWKIWLIIMYIRYG